MTLSLLARYFQLLAVRITVWKWSRRFYQFIIELRRGEAGAEWMVALPEINR
jgi:hypothetical protein